LPVVVGHRRNTGAGDEVFSVGLHRPPDLRRNDMTNVSSTAQVHGTTGTLVLSAQTPYDRQMLREHLERLAGNDPSLTLEMDGTRWHVARRTARGPLCTMCTTCPRRLSYHRADEAVSRCLDCVICPAARSAAERTHE
jgi:hypothetical protein